MSVIHIQIILYVSDQELSCRFYEELLRQNADLHVPVMTEFKLSENCKLGLMPNKGISQILSDVMPHPESGVGIPRCELYLKVQDLEEAFERARCCGAKLISPILTRDWGDRACYFADPDGHIIVFASEVS